MSTRRVVDFLALPKGQSHEAAAEEDETVKTTFQIAAVMRDARRRQRGTQFDLARRVGCSESQIAKIETGRVTPQPWLKDAIAQALNIHSFEVTV